MDWGLVFWTVVLFAPLLWLVRRVHDGLQELFFLLTDHRTAAVYMFQVLLLPGVVLHELSHYVVARFLGVRIRRFSLRPEVRGEKIQMGAVVVDKPDFIRGLMIGLAPLLLGSISVVLIGQHVFDVDAVIAAAASNDTQGLFNAIRAAFGVNDAWIWLYLVFSISNAMLPSESDRESLWPMVVFTGCIVGAFAVAGRGPELISSLAQPVETALGVLITAFGITLFVDVVFAALISALRASISLLTGRRLEKRA